MIRSSVISSSLYRIERQRFRCQVFSPRERTARAHVRAVVALVGMVLGVAGIMRCLVARSCGSFFLITIDFAAFSDEDRAELAAKQRAHEARETEEKQRAADLAANRARDQWAKARGDGITHPYLERKQITPEGVRVSDAGQLLIPMMRGGKMVGLQKIDPAGDKLYNKGMDKIGAAHALGVLAGADVIGIGEGYATCRTGRMAAAAAGFDVPVVAVFDAGNIAHVAKELRRLYPLAHLLFLADDDYQLEHRFIERLREDFNVHAAVPVDGRTHLVLADDGEEVKATAWWRTDAQGIQYIEAGVSKGLSFRSLKYENAGVSRCVASAKAVGNASVAMPVFADRAGRKLTDWNDLHVEESLDTVAEQIAFSILAAKQPKHASSPPAAPAANHALPADVAQVDAAIESTDVPPPPPRCGCAARRRAVVGARCERAFRRSPAPPP